MFDYKPVENLSRIEALKQSQDARAYWKFLWELKKLWLGFGERASALVGLYMERTTNEKLFRVLNESIDLHDVKVDQIIEELSRIDDYIRALNEKLGDGSIHLTAKQIGEMTDE